MAEKLTMPKVGMMESDIVLAEWLVKEGDVISVGDIVGEIESEKTTTQLEAFVSGTILKIVGKEGESYSIGDTLAIVGNPGEDISSL